MNKKTIVVCLVVIVLLLAASFVSGILLGESILITKDKALIDALNSKMMPLVAIGQIESISGQTIILTNYQQSFNIKVKEGVKFATMEDPADPNSRAEVGIQDLKVGDALQVNLSISPDSSIEGNGGTLLSVNLGTPGLPAEFNFVE